MKKTYYDVSMTISETMQVYKNKEEKIPRFSLASKLPDNTSQETLVVLNLHTGTHLDFPSHMIQDGYSSDILNLKRLIRSVKVFDFSSLTNKITIEELQKKDVESGDFLLFKTRNSFEESFNYQFIYLAKDGAEYLVEKGVVGIGIDGLGIERDQPHHPTHKTLFKNDVYIIEGLRLLAVPEGQYFMVAQPIKMPKTDALLLSVVLFDES